MSTARQSPGHQGVVTGTNTRTLGTGFAISPGDVSTVGRWVCRALEAQPKPMMAAAMTANANVKYFILTLLNVLFSKNCFIP